MMSRPVIGHLCFTGNGQSHRRSLTWRRSDLNGASDILQTFTNAKQAEVSVPEVMSWIIGIEPFAKVFDDHFHVVIGFLYCSGRETCLGMLCNVDQNLANRPEENERHLLVQ